jgi:arginine-tRNA-protein transferase
MADMDVFEFAAMIEETPIRSRVIEYRNEMTDELTAVCLTDILEDGVSMVYSFFEPDLQKQSLGTFLILDHIYIARDVGLPYVYLGYWVPGSSKMDYKARFSGLEIFAENKWQPYETLKDDENLQRRGASESIAQQVSNISLPDPNIRK